MCLQSQFSAIVWNAQSREGWAAKVCQAADNCDVTMVLQKFSNLSIQHVGHQGARVTASRGVYFHSSGKLFRGAMARKSDRTPQNLRSVTGFVRILWVTKFDCKSMEFHRSAEDFIYCVKSRL